MLHQQVGDESDFWEQATINFAELPHDSAKVLCGHGSVDSPQMSNAVLWLAGRLCREAFHSAAYDRYYALLHATIEAMRESAA